MKGDRAVHSARRQSPHHLTMAQNVVVPPFEVAPETVVGSTPQSVFPFDFPFWDASDLVVYIDGVELAPTAFTVQGYYIQNGDAVEGGYGSGAVTLNAAVSNCSVTIDRFVVGARESQFSRAAPLGMPSLNSDLNKLTARQQDLARLIGRALVQPPGDSPISPQDVIDAAKAIATRATTNGSNITSADDWRAALLLGSSLSTNRTIYVRLDGNDANSGFFNNSVGAFRTLGRAFDVASKIQFNGFYVNIRIETAGLFNETAVLAGPQNGRTADVVPITLTAGVAGIQVRSIRAIDGALLTIAGQGNLRLGGSGADYALFCQRATVAYSGVDFAAATNDHILATDWSRVLVLGAYSISAGTGYHVHCSRQSYFGCENQTVTLTGNPNFTSGYIGVNFAQVVYYDCTFVGTATGRRYLNHYNGVLLVSSGDGRYVLPGNSQGYNFSGGQFGEPFFVYTPTVTPVTNLTSAVFAEPINVSRVEDIVTVFGVFAITPTAVGRVDFRLSLPVPSDIDGAQDLAGQIVGFYNDYSVAGVVFGAPATDNALVSFRAPETAQRTFTISFSYRVR